MSVPAIIDRFIAGIFMACICVELAPSGMQSPIIYIYIFCRAKLTQSLEPALNLN